MSDFVLSAGAPLDARLIQRFMCWSPKVHISQGKVGGLEWALGRVDDSALWGPANDPTTGTVAFLAGRLALDEAEWQVAASLPYAGGLAARQVLALWKESPRLVSGLLNGALAAIIIEPKSQNAHVWLDPAGAFPVCVSAARSHFFVGSHPDFLAALRANAGLPLSLNEEAVEEFICTGAALHPKTYWSQVSSIDGGTWHTLNFAERPTWKQTERYWRPRFFDEALLDNRAEIVDHLGQAFKRAVLRRTATSLGPISVLLSSGADSRLCVSGAQAKTQLAAFTYYDDPNAELAGAKALADAAGVAHQGLRRSASYYVDHLPESTRLTGGIWGHESSHHFGMLATNQLSTENVLTGCYADYLIKGIALNSRYLSLLGRNLPLKALSGIAPRWHHPHFTNIGDIYKAVFDRLAGAHSIPTRNARPSALDHLQTEASRIFPIWREPDASGRMALHRLSGWDPVFVDREILDVCTRMHPRSKVNGIEFGMAVSRVTGAPGKKVLNNNYGAPVGSGELSRSLYFMLSSARRKLAPTAPFAESSVATAGSWPDYQKVLRRAATLHSIWDTQYRGNAADYPEIVDRVLRAYPYEAAIEHAFLLLRALTYLTWHNDVYKSISGGLFRGADTTQQEILRPV